MFVLSVCLWPPKNVSIFVFILLCFWTFSFSLFLEYQFFLCFCATTFAFRVDELLTGWSPDRATHGLPTVGHRCTVGVLAGTHRCDHSSRQDDESPKRQPYSAALHWCSAALIALLTCLLATLPKLTNAVYSSYDAGKSNQIETCLHVTCMAGKLNWSWHAPLSHASTLSHSQFSLLVLWGSRGSWFASSPVHWLPSPCWWWKVRSSTCVCSSVSPCLDLTSSVQHWSRASWSSSSLSFLDVLAFNYTRVLWHAADFDFFAFRSWNFLIVNVWQFHCRGFLSQLSFFFFNESLFWRFSLIWLSFFCPLFSPFTYLPVIPKSTFFWIVSVFAVSFFLKKKEEERNGVFSCFLFSPLHDEKLFFHWRVSKHSSFLWKKKLFTFTSTNATRSLFERLLCLSILSFCSSSIHLFSLFFWSLRVFPVSFTFFSPFCIFHWSWMSLCFLYR